MVSILGKGSYGRVVGTGSIAKKCVKLNDWEALNSVVREIHVLRMNLPNTVEYLATTYNKKENMVQIKMKRYDMCLRRFLKDERMKHSVVQRHVITQLLNALYVLHGNNIIHRDIKPENILVTMTSARPNVVLCDFGLSRQHCDAGEAYTSYMVTRWYRPPETWARDGKFKPSIDIWSMGCVFYEIVEQKALYPVETFEAFCKKSTQHESLMEGMNESDIKELCINMVKLKARERWDITKCMRHMEIKQARILKSFHAGNDAFSSHIQILMDSNLTSEYTPRVKSYTKMLFSIAGSSAKDLWCCLCIACMLFQDGAWSGSHKISDYVKMSDVALFYTKIGNLKLPQCEFDYKISNALEFDVKRNVKRKLN
jgi:serine/threonine protein kinase